MTSPVLRPAAHLRRIRPGTDGYRLAAWLGDDARLEWKAVDDARQRDGLLVWTAYVVRVRVGTAIVAHASVGWQHGQVCCSAVTVDSRWRRRGLATAMYDLGERLAGVALVPHPFGCSAAARAFWRQRDPSVTARRYGIGGRLGR